MSVKFSIKSKRTSPSGFSLVEVVLAMAIFSTSLLLLLALLPQNLSSMRESSSLSIRHRIAQNLIAELLLNDWDQLHRFDTDKNVLYFDTQGIPTEEYTFDTVFLARVRVMPRDVNIDQDRSLERITISSSSAHSLVDDTGVTASTNQHARRIVVEVADSPIEEFDFDDPTNAKHIVRIGTVVANLNDLDF